MTELGTYGIFGLFFLKLKVPTPLKPIPRSKFLRQSYLKSLAPAKLT